MVRLLGLFLMCTTSSFLLSLACPCVLKWISPLRSARSSEARCRACAELWLVVRVSVDQILGRSSSSCPVTVFRLICASEPPKDRISFCIARKFPCWCTARLELLRRGAACRKAAWISVVNFKVWIGSSWGANVEAWRAQDRV